MTGAHQIQLGLANLTGGLLFFPPSKPYTQEVIHLSHTELFIYSNSAQHTQHLKEAGSRLGSEQTCITQRHRSWVIHSMWWAAHREAQAPAVPWTHSSSATQILHTIHLSEMLCASMSESPSPPSEVSSVELHEINFRLSSPKRKKYFQGVFISSILSFIYPNESGWRLW